MTFVIWPRTMSADSIITQLLVAYCITVVLHVCPTIQWSNQISPIFFILFKPERFHNTLLIFTS